MPTSRKLDTSIFRIREAIVNVEFHSNEPVVQPKHRRAGIKYINSPGRPINRFKLVTGMEDEEGRARFRNSKVLA
ncbi:MAG: hypothetical protein K8F91_25955 [Candidatus Obscuribacterales bacterium]|nr:hypothetical protein [Candidatus Obscuribacterales bacterium]